LHQWDIEYGLPVLRGDILTGRLVYLAVKRHYDDLIHGHKRGLKFVPEHGWHVINTLKLFSFTSKGRWRESQSCLIRGKDFGQPFCMAGGEQMVVADSHVGMKKSPVKW
jgi:hypothetical protein